MKSRACQLLLSLQLPWMIAAFTSIAVPRHPTLLKSSMHSKWTMMPDEPAPEVSSSSYCMRREIHSHCLLFI